MWGLQSEHNVLPPLWRARREAAFVFLQDTAAARACGAHADGPPPHPRRRSAHGLGDGLPGAALSDRHRHCNRTRPDRVRTAAAQHGGLAKRFRGICGAGSGRRHAGGRGRDDCTETWQETGVHGQRLCRRLGRGGQQRATKRLGAGDVRRSAVGSVCLGRRGCAARKPGRPRAHSVWQRRRGPARLAAARAHRGAAAGFAADRGRGVGSAERHVQALRRRQPALLLVPHKTVGAGKDVGKRRCSRPFCGAAKAKEDREHHGRRRRRRGQRTAMTDHSGWSVQLVMQLRIDASLNG
mmetsp:Transcript_13517/g.39153  ORF Transcript_13517/g.39153 Transcript_13517/m.39153 type:complete len:296 (+) Transcript_13517:665-1552(+)